MFNLKLPNYELNKALTILSGATKDVCAMCGLTTDPNRYLCTKCRWHYDRAKYHAVYHFVLRAAHLNREFKQSQNKPGLNWHSKCHQCKKFYGVNDPAEFVNLTHSRRVIREKGNQPTRGSR